MNGPTVAVVYAPDPALGFDPLDTHQTVRRLGEVVPPDCDLLLVWREWGEQFEGGSRTHVVTSGAWSHITRETVESTLDGLGDL